MEIQNGAVAKSYMTNGLVVYGEIFEHFLIYYEALPHMWLCNCSTLNFLIYEENLIFFFISVTAYNIWSSMQYLVSVEEYTWHTVCTITVYFPTFIYCVVNQVIEQRCFYVPLLCLQAVRQQGGIFITKKGCWLKDSRRQDLDFLLKTWSSSSINFS